MCFKHASCDRTTALNTFRCIFHIINGNYKKLSVKLSFVMLFIYPTDLHPSESRGWHRLGVGCWPVVPLVSARLAGLRAHCCCWNPVNIYRQCTVRVCIGLCIGHCMLVAVMKISLHLSVQYFLEDKYEIIMINQYNSIIITDCRGIKICKMQDKFLALLHEDVNTRGGLLPAVAGPGSAVLSDVQPCP